MIQWFLSFRDRVEVLETDEIRRELLRIAESVTRMYEEKSGSDIRG